MVLPSDHHWALRGWLRTRRIVADEYAGILIIKNLDGLLRLAGSTRRFTAAERALVRQTREQARDVAFDFGAGALVDQWPPAQELLAILESLCDSLAAEGVEAEPALGLGVSLGDEILNMCVHVTETSRLYELMRADGFDAEPDWDAHYPFREREWTPTTGRAPTPDHQNGKTPRPLRTGASRR